MSDVPDIHDVLRLSNRTLVAEEITRRGFRVSKETLNRWVRQRKEVPAAVEHIVFDLFGVETRQAAPPEWAERLAVRLRAHSEKLKVSDEDLARAAIEEAAETAVREAGAAPPRRPNGGGSGKATG